LYSLSKIALNRRYAAGESVAINVAQQHLVTCGRCYLRNSMAHRAGAYDAYNFDGLRSYTRVQSFALVLC
jgi:hypothetical protein